MTIKDYKNLPELSEIESNLDDWLYNSQRLYEEAVKKYIQFKEVHIECQIKYEKKFAEIISKYTGKGEKVTIIKEIAQAECSEEFRIMMQTEAKKKRYTMWITAIESRLNMLKYLMRRKYGEMQ